MLQNTVNEWNIIFIIGAAAYILPAIVFMIFGSGSIQSWNEIPVQNSPEIGQTTDDLPVEVRDEDSAKTVKAQ